MIFEKNLPGSSCHQWDLVPFGGARKIPDRVARKIRYRDGSSVYRCGCGSKKFVNDCCRFVEMSRAEYVAAEKQQFHNDCQQN